MQDHVNTAMMDAADSLNCARSVWSYILEKRTPEDNQGESWCLGTVELKILEAIEALNAARLEASHQPG